MIRRAAVLVACFALLGAVNAAEGPGLNQLMSDYVQVSDKAALGIDLALKAGQLAESYTALSDADRRFDPDFSPAGMPRLPSQCAGSDECGQCFAEARRDLNRRRYQFEKLRAIALQTKKMTDDAIALGSSLSSLPGQGLGWHVARSDIMEGWEAFGSTYDDKYREFLDDLRRDLSAVGACEAEYFGEEGWFDRFGFIYYQFMEDRYHPDNMLR